VEVGEGILYGLLLGWHSGAEKVKVCAEPRAGGNIECWLVGAILVAARRANLDTGGVGNARRSKSWERDGRVALRGCVVWTSFPV
jgi:hypothetical protein